MKYIPAPKKIIVEHLPPQEKPGTIIQIKKDEDERFRRGRIISLSPEAVDLKEGDIILYSRYTGVCLDKEKNIFLIDLSECLCVEAPE